MSDTPERITALLRRLEALDGQRHNGEGASFADRIELLQRQHADELQRLLDEAETSAKGIKDITRDTYLTAHAYRDLLDWWAKASEALGRPAERLWYRDLLLKATEFEHSLLSHPEDGKKQLREAVLEIADELYSLRHDQEQLAKFFQQQVEMNREDFTDTAAETILQTSAAIADLHIGHQPVRFDYEKLRDQALSLVAAAKQVLSILDQVLQPVLFRRITNDDVLRWLQPKTEPFRDGKIADCEALKAELRQQYDFPMDALEETVAGVETDRQPDPLQELLADKSRRRAGWKGAIDEWHARHYEGTVRRMETGGPEPCVWPGSALRWLQEQYPALAQGVTEEMIAQALRDVGFPIDDQGREQQS